ncbi:YbjQ family protein [Gemella sp. GH3]|uniref:YbjQ family protein n=1 Tax=unclassified Gemella TaxID=2624949 RepID=UPI0015CFB6FB|nr:MULTISPECIES: YbjQ family protein [unclassified Gemella]MBF0713517.1 YbjQ family protein [Gemella sp. GH3.1]NYS50469.1 YbjQ family protein [Gemella sp. GH3]
MLISTTNNIPGMEIVEYKGLATGEVVSGINFVRDIGAGLRNFFGGRSSGYEKELISARNDALEELKNNAFKLGANAVVGVNIDFESLGQNGSMIFVAATGTAVVVR